MSKLYKVVLGMLALLVLLLSGCTGDSAGKSAAGSSEPDAASVMPADEEPPADGEPSAEVEPAAVPVTFEGTDLDGNALSSEVFSRSKLTMLNVWATYCNPCLSEMPGLGELAAEYEPAEFQIIGIISDVLEGEDQALAEALVQQTGANYPHLLLNESIYYALLMNVSAVPTTFFLDEDGVVLDTVIGAMEKSAWEEIINGLLEKR